MSATVLPRRNRWWGRTAFGLLVVLFLAILLWDRIFITIPPGHVGVLWLRFLGGTVTSFHFGEGSKIIFPWDRVYVYSTRLQRIDHTITSLTREGLPVTMETSLIFAVDPDAAPDVQVAVGPDYATRLIEPLIAAAVQERVADGAPEQLYSVAHRALEADIILLLQQKVGEIGVEHRAVHNPLIAISDFNIRTVILPPIVRQSIEEKLAADQAVRRYRYSIDQERLEAQRREIEAQGIRRFQEIVSPAISDSFLRWRGIEATVALSQSNNSKIVVIGNGGSGLPLILDGRGEAAVTPPAGPPPAAASALQPAPPVGAQPPAAPAGVPEPVPSTPDLPASGDTRGPRQPLVQPAPFDGSGPREPSALQPTPPVGAQPSAAPAGVPEPAPPVPDLPPSGDLRGPRPTAVRPSSFTDFGPYEPGTPSVTEGVGAASDSLPPPPRSRLLSPSARTATLDGAIAPMSRDVPGFRAGTFSVRPGFRSPIPAPPRTADAGPP